MHGICVGKWQIALLTPVNINICIKFVPSSPVKKPLSNKYFPNNFISSKPFKQQNNTTNHLSRGAFPEIQMWDTR